MLIVETIAKIRRMYHVQKKGFKALARELNLSKNTVKKVIREDKTSKHYEREEQSFPVLDELIVRMLANPSEEGVQRRSFTMSCVRKVFQEVILR